MKALIKKIRNNLARSVYISVGRYISYASRPIKAKHVAHTPRNIIVPKKIAVIIQGPLKKEDSFTLETIRLYKKTLLPSTHIIVSTWEDEDASTLAELRALGAHVITSKKPNNNGILNINFQITSVKNGLKVAEGLGAEYILKTRTDVRIYATNVEEYLCGLLKSFPPSGNYDQKYRILGLSFNSNMYRMYNISDIVIFGHISDMLKYWNTQLDTRSEEPVGLKNTLREWSESRMVETYLTTLYLEKIGRTLQWTVSDSFSALAENFIIIDEQSLDIFWYKYNYWNEYRNRNYRVVRNDICITFRDWMSLYANGTNLKDIPENVVDLPFKSKI